MYPSDYEIYAVLVQLVFPLVPKLILGIILLVPTYFVVRQAVRAGIRLAGEDAKRRKDASPSDGATKGSAR